MDVDAHSLLTDKFLGHEAFLDLLIRHSQRQNHVLCRIYSNGSWHQLSGLDVLKHISKSIQNLENLLLQSEKKKQKSVLFLTRNSYASFVTSVACIFMGYNVCFVPLTMSTNDIKWCIEYFNCTFIITDREDPNSNINAFNIPVIGIHKTVWMPEEPYNEPEIISLYKKAKSHEKIDEQEFKNKFKNLKLGSFGFVSVGHDGIQKPELIKPDALLLIARNFILHCDVPGNFFWHSFEIMPPNNPFMHVGRLCTLAKNGILGFPNLGDLDSNLRILKPTFMFVGPTELSQFETLISNTPSDNKTKEKIFEKINDAQNFLATGKAMKIPENVFSLFRRGIITGSKWLSKSFLQATGFDDLKFIVHGTGAANLQITRKFENLGISVIETYGTTHAGGILTSNAYRSNHPGSIGTPLPHVSVRLGAQSSLEYKLNSNVFDGVNKWNESGDIVQMVPFGFIVTGRKKHMFTTSGGSIVSPFRLERLLKEHPLILDACVVGDKMPYLSALIVLNKDIVPADQTPEQTKENVQEIISSVNQTLPRNLTIKKFQILEKPFNESQGERLPNGEINRLKIAESYVKNINDLYGR